MKRILLIFALLIGLSVQANEITVSNVTMDNIWNKLGSREEKVNIVGAKILNSYKITNRVVFNVNNSNSVNAYAAYSNKTVSINKGTLNYIDNDDELAAILAHEIVHAMDYYDGFGKAIVMTFNSKSYEVKADLVAIDYMVNAGYNPVAMITVMNKIGGESIWDWGILWSHPKTSTRLMKDYEYIYKKYPKYLSTDMTKNVNYVNWTYTAQKDINKFQQKEKERAEKRGSL
ncbi:M48 family metalloprotease [bacterium]|nr:M48 family metalloprotease [bacterium]